MKVVRWSRSTVWVFCTAAAAAPPVPYQLCGVAGLPRHQQIESNYRYPPQPAQRAVVDSNRFECTSSFPLKDCFGAMLACGVGERVERDLCGETGEWWYDVSVLLSRHLEEEGAPIYQPWLPNPAVRVAVKYPYTQRVDIYRTWPFASPYVEQITDRQEGRFWQSNFLPRCYTMAYLVGFFNGVWNTRREAWASLEVLKQQDFIGPDWRGAPVRYELFYNQSCKRAADDVCLQDVAEVFRQRSAEMNGLLSRRWEYFWEQVSGQHDQPGSFTQRLVARVVRGDQALGHWFDALANATLAKITALSTALAAAPPTAQDTAGHTAQLIWSGQRAERAVLVAHSQGNLFVNAAYDAYLAHSRQAGAAVGEDTGYVAAQVVHIAPASPTLRGPYVLADSDLVINGLRRVDGTYLPASNVSLPMNAQDRSGHKLLATYLDEAGPVRAQIRQFVTQALDSL